MIQLHLFIPPHDWRIMLALLALLFLLMGRLQGQDLTHSQGQQTPHLLHPAMSGTSSEQPEVGWRYRQQWQVVEGGYQSAQAWYQQQRNHWAWGAQVWQNQAGTNGLRRLGAYGQLAYHQPLGSEGQRLSVGISVGGLQHRLGSLYTYDAQYVEGVGLLSSLPNGEGYLPASHLSADWSAGLAWQGQLPNAPGHQWQVGLTAAHLLPVNVAFGETPLYLSRRWTASLAWRMPLRPTTSLTPYILYQQQGAHSEWQAGGRLEQVLTQQRRLWLGLLYRSQDALIMQAGLEWGKATAWVAYDLNTSGLAVATDGQGAIELGMSYRLGKKAARPRSHERVATPLPTQQAQWPAMLDSDSDGTPDSLDLCPLVFGLPVYRGCNDYDRDGIIDPEDQCPQLFGYPDSQGCPFRRKDSDLDGTPDEEDFCPYLKGLPELRGCPDTDQDGLSDIDDECPYLKGVAAEKGCPPLNKATAAQPVHTPQLMVWFDFDDARLDAQSQQDLAEFALMNPGTQTISLLISGHTDAEGSAAYNYDLAHRRALAVWNYLQGLLPRGSEAQILPYGEQMPLRGNDSETDRAHNRRVEVRLMPGHQ